MGLDQKIIEVKNKKLKNYKKNKQEFWTKYSNRGTLISSGEGLNFYVNSIFDDSDIFDYEKMKKDGINEIYYWRKYYKLQEWYEVNYQIESLGSVRLTENNIDRLVSDIDNKKLIDDISDNEEKVIIDKLKDTLLSIKKQIEQDKNKLFLYTCWY